jgi:hypothetical protein
LSLSDFRERLWTMTVSADCVVVSGVFRRKAGSALVTPNARVAIAGLREP